MSDTRVQVLGSVADIDGAEIPVGYDKCAVTIGIYQFGATELQKLSALVIQARDKAADNAFGMVGAVPGEVTRDA